MTEPAPLTTLDRVARASSLTVALLAVAVGLATVLGLPPAPDRTASLWLVVAVSAVVVWRRTSSARLSLLHGVPAVTLTGSWWATSSAEVWFAYSAESSPVPPGLGPTRIGVAVLLLLLWTLAGIGLLATVRAAGAQVPMRSLAVATMVLTLPIWASSLGTSQLVLVRSAPAAHGAVRTAALVLVLVVGTLVLVDHRRRWVWAAGYVLPAVALTWVGWESHLAVASGVATASSSTIALQGVFLLTALMTPVAPLLLVALLWFAAVSGAATLGRFRPPPAEVA
ncbi:hypothetical protein [Cellulomonas terrae]|uniref:Uncharacterized protein n=1 Tax=Cellulomonas terrae TaxID=311234 RepID=A0A511JQE1_9CELL|nr:hypothetical protein [Cellulomonas terrae]GEM00251.1 hypothetical protein CTE05_37970 [Cellulomonas terrae]